MNTRILTVVGAVTLLCTMTGCSGMKSFLFGRGARCGLCNRLQAPATAPLAGQIPLTKPIGSAGGFQNQLGCGREAGCGTELGCGLERGCGLEAGCGQEAISNSCNCGRSYGPVVSNFGSQAPIVSDPYLSGNIVGGTVSGGIVGGEIVGNSFPIEGQVIDGGYPIEGQVIDGGYPIGGEIIGGGYPIEGQIIGDGSWYQRGSGYSSNKVDLDGHRILSEDPLPPGAIPLN